MWYRQRRNGELLACREGEFVYTTTLMSKTECSVLDAHDTVAEAVDDLRQHWNEEPEGPQLFVVLGENDYLAAVLSRPEGHPELCVTSYADGRSEVHRCRYLLDADGRYDSTEVVEVSRGVLARAG